MWRTFAIVTLGLAPLVLISCGGGGDDKASREPTPDPTREALLSVLAERRGCDYTIPLTATVEPWLYVSEEEAERVLGFDVLLPQAIPDVLWAQSPHLIRNSVCDDALLIDAIEISYGARSGSSFGVQLMERPVSSPREKGSDSAQPIEINGYAGSITRRQEDNFVFIDWSDTERHYNASGELTEELTEEALLRMLESIPES